MITLVKLIDQRPQLAGAMPNQKILELLIDNLSRGLDSARPLRLRVRNDLLEIVDVVEIDVFDLPHRRLNVARHGDVDDEDRPIAPLLHEVLESLAGDDRMGRARGGDDNVGGDQVLVEFFQPRCLAMELRGQRFGFGRITIGQQQFSRSESREALQNQ